MFSEIPPNGYGTPNGYRAHSTQYPDHQGGAIVNIFECLGYTLFGAFPGTVAMDPSETQISHHGTCIESYGSVFWRVLTQQFLGMLQRFAPLEASNLLQPSQDLLQRFVETHLS